MHSHALAKPCPVSIQLNCSSAKLLRSWLVMLAQRCPLIQESLVTLNSWNRSCTSLLPPCREPETSFHLLAPPQQIKVLRGRDWLDKLELPKDYINSYCKRVWCCPGPSGTRHSHFFILPAVLTPAPLRLRAGYVNNYMVTNLFFSVNPSPKSVRQFGSVAPATLNNHYAPKYEKNKF